MEWWIALLLIFGGLFLLMASGMHIAFCFMLVNIVWAFILWGGEVGLLQLGLSIYDSVTTFAILPLPLFVLMGEVMFHSGMGVCMLDVLDKWLGRLPGRLSLIAVGGGTLLSTLSGASMASTAVLGSVLVPEMEKRGYEKPMSLGPILGSGGLSIMIPPSGLAVLLAALGKISIGGLLIAIIIPGILMAILYASYILIRCQLQPSIAPIYEVEPTPLYIRIRDTAKFVLPLGLIVFLVTGVIFLGIATPSEAAATGTMGCFILAAIYGKLNWEVIKKSIGTTIHITVMLLIIIIGAIAFSQILAFSGATRGLLEIVESLSIAPLMIVASMQFVILILGCVMDPVAIMMITLPIFMPIIRALGFDPLWFGAVFLLNAEMAEVTPPFGLLLFVMKGVAPPDTTIGDIYKAGLPFLGCDAVVMALMLAFPAIVLWLPGIVR